jgi:hypothetical protein
MPGGRRRSTKARYFHSSGARNPGPEVWRGYGGVSRPERSEGPDGACSPVAVSIQRRFGFLAALGNDRWIDHRNNE